MMLEHPDITCALRTGYPRQWDIEEEIEKTPSVSDVCDYLKLKAGDNEVMREFIEFVRESDGMKGLEGIGLMLTDFADSIGNEKVLEEINA